MFSVSIRKGGLVGPAVVKTNLWARVLIRNRCLQQFSEAEQWTSHQFPLNRLIIADETLYGVSYAGEVQHGQENYG